MAKKKPSQKNPELALQEQAVATYLQNRAKANPREFRDAITKVTGGVRGIPTDLIQWNRWDK